MIEATTRAGPGAVLTLRPNGRATNDSGPRRDSITPMQHPG